MPRHGIFVEERLRQLVQSGKLSAEVIALRPGRGKARSVGERHGIRIHYLPVPTLPLITNWIDPVLWSHAVRPVVSGFVEQMGDDIILDGHFLYPDGAATALLGRRFGLPVVLTARGSDVNVKCENPVIRRWVRWACESSAAIVTVSKALKKRLAELGVEANKIHVLRNGVDLDKFDLTDSGHDNSGSDAGLSLLSVGHLVEAKGHQLLIEAIARIPEARATIIGEGPDEYSLRQLAEGLGVSGRVIFLGHVPHGDLAEYYRAADATVLASSREGMPNVVLESLACGTRVVATDVGGIAEVVVSPEAGFLMFDRSMTSLLNALRQLQNSSCKREVTRQYAAANLGWQPTIDRQVDLYEKVAGH